MNVEQDRLYKRRILEEVRPLGSRRSIYYRHVPPARNRQPSKGCPRAPLRASRGDRNNIPYVTAPLRSYYGSSSGGSLEPWHMYIDVSFLPPPSAPQLDIRVHRQSNCTGLRLLHHTVLESRLTESP